MEPTSSNPADDRDPAETSVPAEPLAPADVDPSDAAPAAPEPPAPSPLDVGDATPPPPPAPDLGAVENGPLPSAPATATNLDLPSLDLPYSAAGFDQLNQPTGGTAPARPDAPVAGDQPAAPTGTGPGGTDYYESLARQAYGEPAAEPAPPPAATPYADSPYSASPGAAAAWADPQASQPQFGQQPYSQSSYSQQSYGQQSYGQPAYGQLVPASQLSPTDEQTWATAAHWSSLLLSLVSLPFLGPLLIMLIQGPKSARVRANAVESLNFDLTCIIGILASFILMFVFIGFITAPLIGLFWVIFKVIGTIQTANGRDYRYPVNIRMVK
jgi:uncharacterized Tic20 family protein